MLPAASTDSCPVPVTHDLTSASGPSAAFAYHASDHALLHQTLRPIVQGETVVAAQRRVPNEPHPLYMNQSKLDWEFDETRGFLNKILRQDPRARPENLVVDDSHLNFCTSCPHDQGLNTTLHGEETLDLGNRTHPLVDDWPIYSWQNVVRFINRPVQKSRLDLEDHHDVRYGCPCGSVETPDGQVKLYYSSGPHNPNGDGPDRLGYKNRYSTRISPDGRTGWTPEAQVQVNSHAFLGTFTPTGYGALPPTGQHPPSATLPIVAGYEDKHGGACLAYSRDGQEFFNIDNDNDRHGDNNWCLENSNDYLGRAGDTYIQPIVDPLRNREMVLYRQDFGQEGGWREVRGIQVVELNARLSDIPLHDVETGVRRRLASWYLDRLGKLEHYRRHVYCITLTPYSQDLWIGLMTVIEWQKDLAEPVGPNNPPFERDTLNVYLVTSRDGIHVDHEWVYAHQPLLPKDGLTQADWDAGLIMSSATLMTRGDEHITYFEARAGNIHHENRFANNVGKIGVATWGKDRIVGLRTAHGDAAGIITTKRFRLVGGSVRLNVDVPDDACGSSVKVEVLLADDSDGVAPGTVAAGRSESEATPITSFNGDVDARWGGSYLGGGAVAEGSMIRLRFHIRGAAKLYAFQMVPMPPSTTPEPPSPSPPPPAPPSPSPPPPSPSPLPSPPLPRVPPPSPSPMVPPGWPVSPPPLPSSPSALPSTPPPQPPMDPLALRSQSPSIPALAPIELQALGGSVGASNPAMLGIVFLFGFAAGAVMFYCRKKVKGSSMEMQVGSRLANGATLPRGDGSDTPANGAEGLTPASEAKPSKIKGMLSGRKKGYANFSDEDEEQGVALSTAASPAAEEETTLD